MACLLAVAVLVVLGLSQGGGSRPSGDRTTASREPAGSSTVATRPLTAPPSRSRDERRLAASLRAGVARAAALGGEVEVAAMLDDSPEPIVASSTAAGDSRYVRMWSISKVATMVTLLRLLGWGETTGRQPSQEVSEALEGALTRSENCRQRRIVLELQQRAGGPEQVRHRLASTFTMIHSRIVPGAVVEAPEGLCVPYLEGERELTDPLAPALLLGISRWRITDAARLAHALAVDAYGHAVSAKVLELMRSPKLSSREAEPGELTASLEWGAGVAFPGLLPAYKAGWGGTLNGNFLAGQIAIVPLAGGDHLAIAVMFHPDRQPSRDDPGITAAPAAVEAVMEAAGASQFRCLKNC